MFAEVDLVVSATRLSLTDGPDHLLGGVEIAGDLGDWVRGRLGYRREVVSDTLAALKRGITADTMVAEVAVNPLPRLAVGAGYEFIDFSDNNLSYGYDLWLSYLLLTDPTRLALRYTYDFKDVREGMTKNYPRLADGFAAADHPYWAPGNYWRKIFEVLFRHQLTDDPFLRDIPRYYTLRYATIYDSQGYVIQALAGAFSLEWSARLRTEAKVELTSSSEYQVREFGFSLIYRW